MGFKKCLSLSVCVYVRMCSFLELSLRPTGLTDLSEIWHKNRQVPLGVCFIFLFDV